MTGLVLCGGKSSRMGSDKGLLRLEARTWAQTAADKLVALGLPVKLSVNKEQYGDYAAVFSESDLITDAALPELHGPLLGVLSCHLQCQNEDLFVLACDMPLMDAGLLKDLLHRHRQQPSAQAWIYTNDDEPEPLCGIYSAKGLSGILTLLQQGRLVKHSMKYMLDHLSVSTTALQAHQKTAFRNFNAHAELNGM
ncbi:molybdenum cofactor guanylyltransferase [Sediminibacterium soli]|uniref:molybdenum cofactor guanylyltransferase n=1 Tax=Sediminibacterium soli TaxID=2698829 RepID=UPI00137B566C|nr:molybdenum cofactor guanylyltransferase [Sediminibacterium soli]NCI47698.1 molybdenum cofactor guanylyltransferase [Sediminibacterium soli]